MFCFSKFKSTKEKLKVDRFEDGKGSGIGHIGYIGVAVSGFIIYSKASPFIQFLGDFGTLIYILAIWMYFVFGLALVASGYHTRYWFEKISALLFLCYNGKFYFEKILLTSDLSYFGFHIASIGFLFFIITFFLIFKSLFRLKNKHEKEIPEDSFSLSDLFRFPMLVAIILWLIFGQSSFLRIKDGLTNPEVIAKRIYQESSSSYRIGAYCNDGTKSFATGSGACSWHGGVDDWIYETKYYKSKEKCLLEAKEISWLD